MKLRNKALSIFLGIGATGASNATPQLDTHVGQGSSNPSFSNDQTSTTASTLSDQLESGYHHSSISVSYGQAAVSASASAPGDINPIDSVSGVSGKWFETVTITPVNGALAGQVAIARCVFHLNGSMSAAASGGAGVSNQYGILLNSSYSAGATYQGGFNQNGVVGIPASSLQSFTYDIIVYLGTPVSIEAQLSNNIVAQNANIQGSSSAETHLSLNLGG